MSRSTDAGGAASAVDSNDDEEVDEGAEALTDRQILVRAVAGMAGGLGICAAFSDPLVDALSELSQVRHRLCSILSSARGPWTARFIRAAIAPLHARLSA